MVCRDLFGGALFVGYEEEDGGGLIDLVQGISRQAALALVNVRTMEQQQQDAEVSRVLLSLSQGLSSCLDEDALWQLLVRGASEVLELPWSIAARFDERSGTFSIAGGNGVPQADLDAIGNGRFRLEDFPRLQEAITRRELLIGDGATVRPLWLPRGWRSGAWIAVPLFRSGWVAGFVAAGRLQDRRAIDRRQLRRADRRPPQGAAREHRRPAARARGGLRVGDARGPRPAHHDRSRQGLARGPQPGEQRLQVHQRRAGAGAPDGAKRGPGDRGERHGRWHRRRAPADHLRHVPSG